MAFRLREIMYGWRRARQETKAVDVAFAPSATSGQAKGSTAVPTSAHLKIEQHVAYAHRSLSIARDHASTLSDLGLHDYIQLFLIELERMQVDLLRGGRTGRVRRTREDVSQSD